MNTTDSLRGHVGRWNAAVLPGLVLPTFQPTLANIEGTMGCIYSRGSLTLEQKRHPRIAQILRPLQLPPSCPWWPRGHSCSAPSRWSAWVSRGRRQRPQRGRPSWEDRGRVLSAFTSQLPFLPPFTAPSLTWDEKPAALPLKYLGRERVAGLFGERGCGMGWSN